MPQIIVDPDELKTYARRLLSIRNDMLARANAMTRNVQDARDFWDDAKYGAFVRRTEQEMQHIQQFVGDLEEFVRYLGRKAHGVEQYLQRR